MHLYLFLYFCQNILHASRGSQLLVWPRGCRDRHAHMKPSKDTYNFYTRAIWKRNSLHIVSSCSERHASEAVLLPNLLQVTAQQYLPKCDRTIMVCVGNWI